jgi:hypothetical protein
MASKGQLLTKDVLPKLYDQMHKDYGGAMAEQSTTLSGLWSTFKDTISQSLAQAMTPLAAMLKNVLPAAGQVFQDAVTNISDFITGTVIPGLHTLRDWWDHNKTSVGELAAVLKDVFVPGAADAEGSIVGLNDVLDGVHGLRAVLNRVQWAAAVTALDFIQLARFVLNLDLRIGDAIVAVGTLINGIDRLSGGSGHAADAMVSWARDMKNHTRVQLGELAADARRAQQVIDNMRGTDLEIRARTEVDLGKRTEFMLGSLNLKAKYLGHAAGGLVRLGETAIVGEEGPELVRFTGPGWVYPADQTRQILGRGMAKGGPVGLAGLHRYGLQLDEFERLSGRVGLRLGTDVATGLAKAIAMGLGTAINAALGGAGPLGPASGNVVRLALAQAKRMHAIFKVALALIEAGIVESGLRNLNYGDRDSLGFLQQRPSQGWLHPMNITYAAWDFLRRAIPISGRYGTAGQLAQAVQRSAFPARYDAVQSRALGILNAYGYDVGGWLPPGVSVAVNNTGRPEPVGRAGGAITISEGAVQVGPFIVGNDVSPAAVAMVRREVDDAFAELVRVLRVKGVSAK